MKSRDFYQRLVAFKGQDETENQFSRRLGIKLTTFMSWKAGCLPRLTSIEEISRVLRVSPGWLAFEEGKRTSQHG